MTQSKHSQLFSRRCAVLALTLAGCASAPVTTAPARSANAHGETKATLPRTVVTPESATDIPGLFQQATVDGQARRYETSAREFERCFSLDLDGSMADKCLFESAEMFDLAGQHEAALARYEQVVRRFPTSDLDRVARVRALTLLTYLEQYTRAGALAEQTASKYKDLLSFDQIAVLAAQALAHIDAGDDVHAESFISKARDIIERESLDAAGRIPSELAPVYYALGELRRVRAERIHFVPVPDNFGVVLEQRCQSLLDAQGAYSDAMRAYDSHWSAMAGFRVGELYQKLHEELMGVPAPKAADTERRRQLFEGAMRLRYSILLDKAKAMIDHTVAMADRTGEQSQWVLKSRQARDTLVEAIAAERSALARLPYSREQLQAALDSFSSGRVP